MGNDTKDGKEKEANKKWEPKGKSIKTLDDKLLEEHREDIYKDIRKR